MTILQLLQRATPGKYEHRALMYALYELRRNIHKSLEEWEFLESEIVPGEVLGEGSFAGVRACTWLSGSAAVKILKGSKVGSQNTILSTKVLIFTATR